MHPPLLRSGARAKKALNSAIRNSNRSRSKIQLGNCRTGIYRFLQSTLPDTSDCRDCGGIKNDPPLENASRYKLTRRPCCPRLGPLGVPRQDYASSPAKLWVKSHEPLCIQKYDVTVMEAIYHVVEHFSMHTGQILFATKMLTGTDLGFYRHLSSAAAARSEVIP